MTRLVASKSLRYNHRRMIAGDEFDALNELHAELLIAARKARRAPYLPRKTSLKEVAESLGIAVDGRWGDRRLQAEIDLKRSHP